MNDYHKSGIHLIEKLDALRAKIGASKKSAASKRIESEERFHDVVEHIREVFWVAKADLSEVTYISPGDEKVWGRSCDSVYDNPASWMDSIHPEDIWRVRTALGQREAGFAIEYRIVRPDGRALDTGPRLPRQKRGRRATG